MRGKLCAELATIGKYSCTVFKYSAGVHALHGRIGNGVSMNDNFCKYEQVEPGVVCCKVCGHRVKTPHPPERCFRVCAPPPQSTPLVTTIQSRGLGDTIAKLTHATGIAQAVEAVTSAIGVPCGCKERQEWLNKVVPYQSPPTTTE